MAIVIQLQKIPIGSMDGLSIGHRFLLLSEKPCVDHFVHLGSMAFMNQWSPSSMHVLAPLVVSRDPAIAGCET